MAKILIAGCGVGGAVCAYYLAKAGFDVTVYDKADRKTVSYDWHDDIAKDAFEAAGLPLPPEEIRFDKRNWTFVPPENGEHVYTDLPEATDYSVWRRPLLHWLEGLAIEAGAMFCWNTETALFVCNEKVRGLVVDGKAVECDLVIDNCGLDSALRAHLPEEYRIPRKAAEGAVFCAYRAFFDRIPDVTVEETETNRVYLLHRGERGISWCLADPASDMVDVLVGKVDALSQEDIDAALQALRSDNPVLGNELKMGGNVYRIAITHPAYRMVGDGYCMLGDSAGMTIPLLGSGMAASMLAGRLLADTIVERQSVSKQALWRYQVAFYRACGADFCQVDVLKNWLLQAAPQQVKWLFASGVLSKDDINTTAAGKPLKLTVGDMAHKLCVGYKQIGLLLKLWNVLRKGQKAARIASEIPQVYNVTAINAWEQKMDAVYGGGSTPRCIKT